VLNGHYNKDEFLSPEWLINLKKLAINIDKINKIIYRAYFTFLQKIYLKIMFLQVFTDSSLVEF